MYLSWKITGMGIIKVISTSKIKKIIAIKKNCIENGVREKNCGLNPHSKGEIFSRSIKDFFPINEFNKIIRVEIISERKKIIKIIFFKRSLKLEALSTVYTKNIRTSSINRYV